MNSVVRRSGRAFVLLEVTLAVVILGVAAAVFMRSFVQSMAATRRIEITMKATFLARALLESYDLFPPEEGKSEGRFADHPMFGPDYKEYSWVVEREDEEIVYDSLVTEGLRRKLVPYQRVHLEIVYDNGRDRRFVPVEIDTALMGFDPFSANTRQNTQLF